MTDAAAQGHSSGILPPSNTGFAAHFDTQASLGNPSVLNPGFLQKRGRSDGHFSHRQRDPKPGQFVRRTARLLSCDRSLAFDE
jgi:hypothetical protein